MIHINIDSSVKIKDTYSAFISFDYDNKIVARIRKFPFRFYHTSTRTWELPVSNIKEFIESMKGFKIELSGKLSALNVGGNKVTIPKGFSFKTEPFKHQMDGVLFGLEYDRWFLGDEQGLGKTKQAIDIAVARKVEYGYKHCLIVCGVNTLKWNWKQEIAIHSNESGRILGQKYVKGKLKIGGTSDKVRDLNMLLSGDFDFNEYFLITNVESFRDEGFASKIEELCSRGLINMCVADEMHKMKNPSSKQSKGFLKCQPECRIGMTGTPLMNNPLDLYVILNWLGYESHKFYSFKKHYCVMGGYGGYEVVGYKNMDQLIAQIRTIMLRRLKDDVLDLPEKTYIDEFVEMDKAQTNIYNIVKAEIKSELANIDFDPNPLAKLIRLRQATGYTGILSSEVQESAKLDRMLDIVEECCANNRKVLIFSNWTKITDEVINRLRVNGYRCSAITGNTPDAERDEIKNSFQTNADDIKVLVGTIGAMGTGLTLTAASTVIFMDEPWTKALYDQAVDRTHRIGQSSNVTVYNLLCKDTIDERIHDIVYKKGLMSDAIIDGKIVGDKNALINYLLD